ncbi:carboxy-terminal kinesin 2 [Gaeumannomyces tritici R3-111a-1]|uniref:Kinesin-like protein n=1 Tax=Gaeumannomyces tritici (strain R3-111a-1) TaxID=644352 RepID=J3NXK8_GAET3|nr:carboxy-terminal kinesin 2 [Gaeumannomyces tritici R3-111a-1]EJT76090.1 carboxy-terminal kinesin 2 [Gaeumannomyces tritici R3-111a-1]
METTVETTAHRPSGLRPPSRAFGLHEISESQSNARAAAKSTMLPPPQVNLGSKRINSEFPQPDAKQRKTLAERGGECYAAKPSVSATPAPRGHVKATSIVGLSGIRPPSAAGMSSLATKAPTASAASRQPPKNSYAFSVGPGARPPTAAAARQPPSSFAKSISGASRGAARTRPATAFGAYGDIEEAPLAASSQQNAWDVDERLNEVESQWKAMKDVMNLSMNERKAMEQVVELATSKAEGLEKEREKLDAELAGLRHQVQTLTLDLETERRSHKFELDGQARDHQHELERLRREVEDQMTRAQRRESEAVEAAERRFRAQLEEERARNERQMGEIRSQLGSKQQEASRAMHEKDRDIDEMRSQIERLKGDLDREVTLKDGVQKAVIEMTTANLTLEAQIQQLTGKVRFLESSNQQQSDSFSEMEARLQEALDIAETAREKLIKEETERRVLFNKYQELKGNIRVMCRVRPVLGPSEGAAATLDFPDLKTSAQLDVTGPEERSATGNISRKTMPFEFDRVFTPQTQNEEIFGEISQLVQSALDGYNVCIFCYGQTGSGKTFTMSSADGMIPRAVHMIYDEAERLRDKSWSYQMVGSFIEVYNEELHDLLAAEGVRRKLSIQHDDVRKQTTVVNCRTVPLDSAGRVEQMLEEAQSNRSVAATKANERSSRSHSVFVLKLVGENAATGERCEGTLNLVDLAGSERLKHSQVEGDRMRETQNINKSLSCLGDVIEALGKGQGHVPYRNSKLTHLLQYSLGGNSKTLMFVMVSPLEAHLKETITSLRFATKVHNTHIGTAKSTKKLRDHRDST